MLAGAAQVDHQLQVHAIGINWTRMVSPTTSMAIVVLAEVPPEEAPAELSLTIELFDSEGAPVKVPSQREGQVEPFKVYTVATAQAREPGNVWETVRVPFVVSVRAGLSAPPGNYKFAIRVGRKGGHTLGDELRFCIVAKPGA